MPTPRDFTLPPSSVERPNHREPIHHLVSLGIRISFFFFFLTFRKTWREKNSKISFVHFFPPLRGLRNVVKPVEIREIRIELNLKINEFEKNAHV